MKGLSTHIVKTLVPGAVIPCADNSGAYEFRMIHLIGKTDGRHGKMSAAGIGDIVSASVRKGTATYLKKPVRVVIIRQKQTIRRSNGMRVKFEDNAGIMVSDDNLPIGTEVKGAMAREVVERFVKIAGVASRIV
ncbi:MAG: uL14 family ribosomal protein [Candidatus Marsarchaeota archaeon]|nr:uL14 family ribosomal protein [Candidatus Marsarchaeota archaeon]MCL5413128.1 uL14 family ribosomal protein [Candidatus Marsarchaeota archaeon]